MTTINDRFRCESCKELAAHAILFHGLCEICFKRKLSKRSLEERIFDIEKALAKMGEHSHVELMRF